MKTINQDIYSEIEIFHMVLNEELSRYPVGFWTPPDGIIYATNILKYLIEKILQWDDEDILHYYDINVLRKYKLNGMVTCIFNSSPFEALNATYPNKFKIWQFKVPNNYWKNDENVKEAVKYIYEELIGITDPIELYKINNHRDIFARFGIDRIPKMQDKTIHEVIFMVYPELCEEGFNRRSVSAYTIEKQIETLRRIIKDKKMKHEDIVKMSAESLKEYNLYAFLVTRHKMDIYDIMELVFPGEFKPWEFPKIKSGFWKDEKNICEAVKWLVDEKLKFDTNKTIRISRQDFFDNGLKSLVDYAAINHIGIKNLIRLIYKDCEIKFK